jgi:metallo-beta-lactamase family protein
MKISFHGAARSVTGSKHLISTPSGFNLLLDCGLFQNAGSDNENLNRHFGFEPASVNAVLLSHAHADHAGNLPFLVKQGFSGTIYTTQATIDLCSVMLPDSAYIQQHDLEYINKKRKRKGLPSYQPLYTIADVEKTLNRMKAVNLHESIILNNEISAVFYSNGHILGSAAIMINYRSSRKKSTSLFFTGDIGRYGDMILKDPEPFPQADYIICESTYGNKLHDDFSTAGSRLREIILQTCVDQKGKLLIPAFSLGRTQEIVYQIDRMMNNHQLPPLRVFVDSPLSTSATAIMRKHAEQFNDAIHEYMKSDPDPFGFPMLQYIRDVNDSKKLNDLKEPCIIIAPSGMMEAGRIKHHLKNHIGNPANAVLIVGFTPPNSLGGKLAAGEKKVRIFGEEYDVKASVYLLNAFSAHADFQEMLKYLKCQDFSKVKELFLVHGEYDVQEAWKETLGHYGFKKVSIPEIHSVFTLN